jgi:hypothetical protein
MKMVEDYRDAISYLQGEPGVDPDRIGVWGGELCGRPLDYVVGMVGFNTATFF